MGRVRHSDCECELAQLVQEICRDNRGDRKAPATQKRCAAEHDNGVEIPAVLAGETCRIRARIQALEELAAPMVTLELYNRRFMGIAEAMDTAQRGMGLSWGGAQELIRRSLAAARGRKDTLPAQLAVWQRATPDEVASWSVLSQAWDHVVEGPLAWEEDGLAVLACAEDRGSRRLWRFDIADRRAEAVYPAPGHSGWVSSYDKRAGTSVVVADSAEHPARAWALLPGQAPRRMERCNDAVLDGYRLRLRPRDSRRIVERAYGITAQAPTAKEQP